jgi:hypothetical protein
MPQTRPGVYESIHSVLVDELAHAQALETMGQEIEALISTRQFKLASKKLVQRGRIIDRMVSMDRELADRLSTLSEQVCDHLRDAMQNEISDFVHMMASILDRDRIIQNDLQTRCDQVGRELKSLRRGKKSIRGYRQAMLSGRPPGVLI